MNRLIFFLLVFLSSVLHVFFFPLFCFIFLFVLLLLVPIHFTFSLSFFTGILLLSVLVLISTHPLLSFPLLMVFLSSDFSSPPLSITTLPSSHHLSHPVPSFCVSHSGGESGGGWSLQRAGDFPDPGDKSQPDLITHPPGPRGFLWVKSLPVYLPLSEMGWAK